MIFTVEESRVVWSMIHQLLEKYPASTHYSHCTILALKSRLNRQSDGPGNIVFCTIRDFVRCGNIPKIHQIQTNFHLTRLKVSFQSHPRLKIWRKNLFIMNCFIKNQPFFLFKKNHFSTKIILFSAHCSELITPYRMSTKSCKHCISSWSFTSPTLFGILKLLFMKSSFLICSKLNKLKFTSLLLSLASLKLMEITNIIKFNHIEKPPWTRTIFTAHNMATRTK